MASNEIRLSNYQLPSGRFIGCSQIPYASNIHDQDIKAMQRMYGQGGPTYPAFTYLTHIERRASVERNGLKALCVICRSKRPVSVSRRPKPWTRVAQPFRFEFGLVGVSVVTSTSK